MLSSWYKSLPGSLLYQEEQEQLTPILEHIFGKCLVQMGGPVKQSLQPASPISLRVYVSQEAIATRSTLAVQTRLDELPFAPNSIDVAVIFHQLEFSAQPQQMLQQVYQSLVGNGQLILFSFNPWSLWGLLKHYNASKKFPWDGNFWSAIKIKRWLRAIGYSIIAQKTVGFRPPLEDPAWMQRLLFLEALGQFCLPACGATNLIVAQKIVPGMTPLFEPVTAKKKVVVKRYAEPTNIRSLKKY